MGRRTPGHCTYPRFLFALRPLGPTPRLTRTALPSTSSTHTKLTHPTNPPSNPRNRAMTQPTLAAFFGKKPGAASNKRPLEEKAAANAAAEGAADDAVNAAAEQGASKKPALGKSDDGPFGCWVGWSCAVAIATHPFRTLPPRSIALSTYYIHTHRRDDHHHDHRHHHHYHRAPRRPGGAPRAAAPRRDGRRLAPGGAGRGRQALLRAAPPVPHAGGQEQAGACVRLG